MTLLTTLALAGLAMPGCGDSRGTRTPFDPTAGLEETGGDDAPRPEGDDDDDDDAGPGDDDDDASPGDDDDDDDDGDPGDDDDDADPGDDDDDADPGDDDDDDDAGTTGGPGNDLPPGPLIGTFELTYYWLADESAYPGPAVETLYAPGCEALATVSAAFADAITLEGTGRLNDGRVLNYHSACGCGAGHCFFEVDEAHPWGHGVQNRALVPFRSIAIDDSVLSIGTAIYVEELDGVTMPGEAPWGDFVHDGCLVPDDIGGAIIGQHIDFFSALIAHYQTLDAELGLSDVTIYAAGERCASYSD